MGAYAMIRVNTQPMKICARKIQQDQARLLQGTDSLEKVLDLSPHLYVL